MKIKHSKYKNTGILFELLVRQITADTLKGGDSPAIDILKKYFVKSELSREYKLYESILKSKVLSESHANVYIETTLSNSKHLNRSILKKQKYNLINEIKQNYDLSTFFGSQISDYKTLASIYTLLESTNITTPDNKQLIKNKINLLEHLTKKEPNLVENKENVLQEFSTYDKDLRSLTYRILLEKFNEKYDILNQDQKQVLKEYINSVDSTPGLRKFYNSKIDELKNTLSEQSKNTKDKATKIKIQEVAKMLLKLDNTSKVNDDHLIDLLQYYELIKEVKIANGVQI
ncbi:hypothetical protein BVX94_02555 [bacterium B17]|jgi:hypothetical protein|nr:hypothetical protein BVX94_02555 [bacterium B17]